MSETLRGREMETIGARLKEIREKSDLTLDEFANKINLTKGIIWSYELGKKEPSINHLKRIAEFFNISLEFLIYGVEEKIGINLNEELIKDQFFITVDEIEVSQDELLEVIAYIKAKRIVKKELMK
ncbi:helix-turn-helix transcriptional regulator [Rossellomorea sp. YZS02]|uniref:helix-turn-helix domain-containing protein n=1 Tax=Rossellomorea sp. YZS02 TaxID=3097358 RepID=UPI002A0B83DD|nr:helix-turn-helix transcriptional regulator [Rossellomorea sp. YZS02]MDX8344502.1 helix-turn-helix transcriptional regulator [Rossellomorea sp. YZS02]